MADQESFKDKIKFDIDYSKIDFEKYRNGKTPKPSSEAPVKNERERVKWEEGGIRERKEAKCDVVQETADSLFNEVNGEKRDLLIDKVIKLESEYLGIKPPDFAYYSYEGPNSQYGFYSSLDDEIKFADGSTMEVKEDTIYINTALSLQSERSYQDLLKTVIHELRHHYQASVRKSKRNHPEISAESREYLQYSTEKYKEDRDNGRYPINGLEWDSNAFANARIKLYMQYTADEILAQEKAPTQVVKNQILMNAGDISPSGYIAPVTASVTLDEFNLKNNSKERFGSKNIKDKGGKFSMAVNGGTDFSEKAQEAAAAKYEEVIESIHVFSENVIIHFFERVKGHPYQPLEDVGNIFIKSYNEELPGRVKDAIRSWRQSDNSFSASISNQFGNNAASKAAAEKIENEIEQKVDVCFKTIQPIKINEPISVAMEAIIGDAEYIEGLSTELEKKKDEWLSIFMRLGETENSLYSNMGELVVQTFNRVEEEYQAVYKTIMDVSEEFKGARAAVITTAQVNASSAKKDIKNIVSSFQDKRKTIH